MDINDISERSLCGGWEVTWHGYEIMEEEGRGQVIWTKSTDFLCRLSAMTTRSCLVLGCIDLPLHRIINFATYQCAKCSHHRHNSQLKWHFGNWVSTVHQANRETHTHTHLHTSTRTFQESSWLYPMCTGLDWRRIGTKPREWWRMDWIQLPGLGMLRAEVLWTWLCFM